MIRERPLTEKCLRREPIFHNLGNEAEARPTDSKVVPSDDSIDDAPSGGSPDNNAFPSGLESVEGETTQNEDEIDAEDADAAEDKDTDDDAHRLTDIEIASDVTLEEINEDKFIDNEHHKEIEVENTDYGKDRAGVDDVVEKDPAQISDDDDLGFELVNVAKL